jgi:hypothetical protein
VLSSSELPLPSLELLNHFRIIIFLINRSKYCHLGLEKFVIECLSIMLLAYTFLIDRGLVDLYVVSFV